MNLERACSLLEISRNDLHTPLLKKKFKSKCLQFHPDKRGDKQKFIELKEAYDFILSQPKQDSFLDEFDEKMLRNYLYTLYKTDFSLFKHPLFVRHFIDPVHEHLNQYKTYTLCPTLEHVFKQDIYYLEEEQLYIPLWHHEIIFHGKIKVIIIPKLPSHIEIDENNDILVQGEIKDFVELGNISILLTETEKKEKRIIGKGIPRLQQCIYDTDTLSDLILLPS